MRCIWEEIGSPRRVRCRRCGWVSPPLKTPLRKIHATCQAWPLSWELGHWLAIFLAAAGITGGRWNWLRARLGLAKSCKCGEREESLNSWGAKLASWLVSLRKSKWFSHKPPRPPSSEPQ